MQDFILSDKELVALTDYRLQSKQEKFLIDNDIPYNKGGKGNLKVSRDAANLFLGCKTISRSHEKKFKFDASSLVNI